MPKISTYQLVTPTAEGDEVLGLRNGAVVRFPANDADALVVAAEAAKTAAESARDAALIQGGVYVDEPTGRAAVADGVAFKVQGSGDVAAYEYRRTNSAASVLIASYPSVVSITALRGSAFPGPAEIFESLDESVSGFGVMQVHDKNRRVMGGIRGTELYAQTEVFETLDPLLGQCIFTDADGRVLSDPRPASSTDMLLPEVVAARGSRIDLQARIGQHLNAYGLPKRPLWGEWYLRETRQRLRKRALGENAQLVVASLGDSWTHNADRWCRPTARTLISNFGDAGAGWSGFASLGGSFPNDNIDSENVSVTRTGTWDYANYAGSPGPDLGQVSSSTVGSKIAVTVPASASALRLFYIGSVGEVRYRFDAGAWTTLDLAGSGLLTALLAGVPATAFPLEVEVLTGAVSLCGVDIQKTTSGVRWHKLGSTGSSAGSWAAIPYSQWRSGITALAPNLVTIMFGTNDQTSGITPADFAARLKIVVDNLRLAVPLADILIVMPCENGRANAVPMSAYTAAAYAFAAENKCAFLDLQYVFGETYSEYSSTSARAWFNADLIHPEPLTGGRAIADAVYRALVNS